MTSGQRVALVVAGIGAAATLAAAGVVVFFKTAGGPQNNAGTQMIQTGSGNVQIGPTAIALPRSNDDRALVYDSRTIAGALTFNDERAQLPVTFTLHNTGKAISERTSAWAHIYPMHPNAEIASLKDRPAACVAPSDAWGKVGVNVFPGTTVTLSPLVIEPASRSKIPKSPTLLIVAGCVIYKTVGQTAYHVTPFIAAIVQASGLVFDPSMGVVSKGLHLESLPNCRTSHVK